MYFPTLVILAPFVDLKVPILGQRSGEAHCLYTPIGPEFRPTQVDHRTVPRSSAQHMQNRESLRVCVVGKPNLLCVYSASSFEKPLTCFRHKTFLLGVKTAGFKRKLC